MKILEEIGLSFDDVLLVPRKSTISSRFSGGIDLSTEIVPGIKLKYPVISANMDTVTGYNLAGAMNNLGGLGIIHRFLAPEEHLQELYNMGTGYNSRVLCIGVGTKEFEERFIMIWEKFNHYVDGPLAAVLIDVAHGHCDAMVRQIERVKRAAPDMPIIAGNVATYEGAHDLISAGVHSIKCGVGPGSVCSTRIQTGNGVPQMTAIMECRRAAESLTLYKSGRATIVADGGIRNGGDVVKSLACGADAVMVGNLFAGTTEALGDIVSTRAGGLVKAYRGMASREAQKSWKGFSTSIEGEMMNVHYKGPLDTVFNSLISGVLSGMSYQDAKNIEELYNNAVFRRQTSAGYRESLPHGLNKDT